MIRRSGCDQLRLGGTGLVGVGGISGEIGWDRVGTGLGLQVRYGGTGYSDR